ncbi:MAG: TonB-dependent receptor [Pseudomonadota bacterium]
MGEPSAVIVASQGVVTLRDLTGTDLDAQVGSLLCPGDRLRTGSDGAVELRITGSNSTIGAHNDSILVIAELTAAEGPDITLVDGLLRFISSVEGYFEVGTPFAYAGIDGTEAVIVVDAAAQQALFLVREGDVETGVRGGPDPLMLAAGQAAFVSADEPLRLATADDVPARFRPLLLDPAGASDWAVYYPPVLLSADSADQRVRAAAEALAAGQPDRAEALLTPPPDAPTDRAAALALRSIAAVFRNRPEDGTALAEAAIESDPTLGAGHVALSYARQAGGDPAAALTAATAAVDADPDDAYAWARVAELALTLGDRRAAEAAIARSLALQETALARSIEGFVRLSFIDLDAAQTAFRRSIEIDSGDPLARLGLGLTLIRDGRGPQGRAELENAVALDPRRARLRTWLGRAYIEAAMGERALAQFRLAEEEDPDDPNAPLFRALQLFIDNRPVEALSEVEDAIALSPARAPIRSRIGLGEDAAVGAAALGRLYLALGLEDLAVTTADRAVSADPTNPEAHRFLADALQDSGGSEFGRTSSAFRGNLLTPPSSAPIDLFLNEPDLALLETAGPARLSFAELAPVFEENGFSFFGTAFAGTQETLGEETSLTLVHDTFSFSAGQLFLTSDGYRVNNDLQHSVFGAQATWQVSPEFSLFGEYIDRQTDAGDRLLNFDLEDAVDSLTTSLDRRRGRAGFRADLAPSQTVIGAVTYSTLDTVSTQDVFFSPFFSFTTTDLTEDESIDAQVQHIGKFGRVTTVSGLSFAHVDGEATSIVFGFPDLTETTTRQANVYTYVDVNLPDPVTWTFGLSYDRYEEDGNALDRSELFPKVGVEARITPNVTVRGALFQSLSRRLVTEQTLEPITVAGFEQFEDTLNSVEITRGGAGFDVRLGPIVRAGVEGTYTIFEFPLENEPDPETKETKIRGYISGAVTNRLVLTLDGDYQRLRSDAIFDFDQYDVVTGRVAARYFHPSGFFANAEVEVGHQEQLSVADSTTGAAAQSDTFTLLNGAVGYRLPNRRGVISLEVENLLDTDINFQERELRPDVIPVPTFARSRTVFLRGTIQF